MFNIIIWSIYGIFVGSIAKAIIPGEENFGFIKTVALGVVGYYMGGAIMYMIGSYQAMGPAGIFMGVIGSCIAIILYNRINVKS